MEFVPDFWKPNQHQIFLFRYPERISAPVLANDTILNLRIRHIELLNDGIIVSMN
jgi:hypothetical protein